ncbi:hypothetical protein KXS11_12920 [Plantibacter flavus]|uniref:hypothetical protein n=1 Tax=Plantibacter flavus TaxID=150123 RepID=UPI003F154F6B
MSDDLTLRGGGVVAVATDGHLALADGLVLLAASCEEWASRVEAVAVLDVGQAPMGPTVVPVADGEAGRAAAVRAARDLRSAAEGAGRLGGQLLMTAEAYGNLERAVAAFFERTDGAVGWAVGSTPALWMTGVVSLAAVALLGTVVRGAVGFASADAGQWLDDQGSRRLRELAADPAFVQTVRRVVSSTDEALAGFGGPIVGLDLLRRTADGVPGVAVSTLLVARGADAAGLFTPTGVRVAEAPRPAGEPDRVLPPTTHEELAARMPRGGEGSAQVRIERHVDAAGAEQWIVWSGGTIDTGFPTDGTEPWDNRSNLYAVAAAAVPGLAAESTRATLDAMALAGIPKGASVLHVGYSQGGIVAGAIAASGDYDSSLVTFGSPVETIDLPDGVARTHFEHTEDLIPALSGRHQDPLDGGTVVSRSVFDGRTPPDGDHPLPAHDFELYRETAALADASDDPRVREAIQPLTGLVGSSGSTLYRADRTQ